MLAGSLLAAAYLVTEENRARDWAAQFQQAIPVARELYESVQAERELTPAALVGDQSAVVYPRVTSVGELRSDTSVVVVAAGHCRYRARGPEGGCHYGGSRAEAWTPVFGMDGSRRPVGRRGGAL